ncbi:hypothetical protein [Amphibacillus indicireducens]|uniref:Uncharacterized protein n=1 Tax=Amphibacillus indicireducens TaxID=1076330 RepID=A0ABP7VLE9_9BACI
MSVKTIEKVKEIERQAEALERDYEQQLLELKKSNEIEVSQLEDTLASELATFKAQETEKLTEKLQQLKATNQKEAEEQLVELERVFYDKKEELVQAVVKEVMRKYGNS